jgi:vitamin-K-epoxide reductase (warfarin-sensitive)
MRYVIAVLAVTGIAVSTLALVSHFGSPADPLDLLNSNWNSAYVNQSSYAEVSGIPGAVLGIVGYTLLAILALLRHTVLTVYIAGAGLVYALYFTDVQAHILQVWCPYHVSSLIVMFLIAFLSLAALVFEDAPAVSR